MSTSTALTWNKKNNIRYINLMKTSWQVVKQDYELRFKTRDSQIFNKMQLEKHDHIRTNAPSTVGRWAPTWCMKTGWWCWIQRQSWRKIGPSSRDSINADPANKVVLSTCSFSPENFLLLISFLFRNEAFLVILPGA